MAKPLTLYRENFSPNGSRVEIGMHTFSGPIHVVLVMDWPDDDKAIEAIEKGFEVELVPKYFQVHCPQYQQPMIFEATKKNLKSYWNWQAGQ